MIIYQYTFGAAGKSPWSMSIPWHPASCCLFVGESREYRTYGTYKAIFWVQHPGAPEENWESRSFYAMLGGAELELPFPYEYVGTAVCDDGYMVRHIYAGPTPAQQKQTDEMAVILRGFEIQP